MKDQEAPLHDGKEHLSLIEPATNSKPARTLPPDKYHLALIIFLLLGTGVLLPWNAFLTAYDYFAHYYPDFPFEFVLGLVYNYPNCACLFVAIWLGPKIPFSVRLLLFFAVDMFVLVLVPAFTSTLDAGVSLYINLGLAAIAGAACAFLFGTVTALAALFPGKNITASMVGNGIAGIVVSVVRIITKATLSNADNSYEISGILYFSIAGFTILLCIVGSVVLLRLNLTRVILEENEKHRIEGQKKPEGQALLGSESRPTAAIKAVPLVVLRKVAREAAMVGVTFFVTLALFPGVTTLIPSSNDDLGDWFQVILITIFCVGDFIGRSGPYLIRIPRLALEILTYSRLVFFLLFILSGLDYMVYNWLTYIMMAVFAVTNGYCGTLSLMYGPQRVSEHERELAGLIMSFCLNFGIFIACNFSMLLLYILTGSIMGTTTTSSSSSASSSLSASLPSSILSSSQ